VSDYPFDGKDGTPILLMNWKDMDAWQRMDFILLLATLCAPILGFIAGVLACWMNDHGWI
jgi:hypothetical protein